MLSSVAPLLTVDEVLKAVSGVNWRRLGEELVEKNEPSFCIDDIMSSDCLHLEFLSGRCDPPRTNLDRIHDQHESDMARLGAVVEEFLDTGISRLGEIPKAPSWKRVIWALYRIDEINKAQQIRSYAEPLEGMQLLIYTNVLFGLASQCTLFTLLELSCHLVRGVCCN